MSFIRNIVVSLLVSPLIAFSSRSVFAFSITPTQPGSTGFFYPEVEYYPTNRNKWVAKIDPLSVVEVLRGGTTGLNDLFFPFRIAGWTFNTGSNLEGSFKLTGFEAFGASDRVGSNLYLDYLPAGNDPVNNDQTELHWIQRVISNNNVTDKEGYGNPEDTIDVPDRSLPYTDPGRLFYDYKLGFPTPPSFQDGPRRVQVDGSNKWRAELYLASFSRSDPYNVTIYNGISWGWKNEPVVDFTFVVDTTGSMGSYIGIAQATMNQFLNRLETVGVDYRVAIADFKDFPSDSSPNDYPYLAALPFTSDRTSIINTVSTLGEIIGGGGDTPESSYSALIRAMRTENLGPWRSGAEKIMFLITDAPPHDPELFTGYTLQDVVSEAAIKGKVRIFSQIPGGNSSAVSYFSSLSSRTNGNSCTTEESCAAILFALLGSQQLLQAMEEVLTSEILPHTPTII